MPPPPQVAVAKVSRELSSDIDTYPSLFPQENISSLHYVLLLHLPRIVS